jgi:kinesin family protein 23
MKFAEMTQEIQMSQPVVTKLDFGLTPGRRKANQVSLMCNLYLAEILK